MVGGIANAAGDFSLPPAVRSAIRRMNGYIAKLDAL